MSAHDEEQEITVRKISSVFEVSCCMLGTCEPGDHPPGPKQPWYRRVRWELAAWWFDNRPRIHRGPCNHDDCSW